MHNSLFQFLTNDAAIATIVGGRIYHEWAPQTIVEWPLLVFQLVTATEIDLDMDAPGGSEIEQASYQFDLYARTSADAVAAAAAFDLRFRNFRGTMGAIVVQAIEISNMTHLGERIGDKQVRRVSIDYRIFYNVNEA